jgi:hypothetical protein
MNSKEVYAQSVAAGVALLLGGCATPLKNEHPEANLTKNPPETRQPKVPFNAGECVKFAVELAHGKTNGRSLSDIEGKDSYYVSNRGHWIPPDSAEGQVSENTVEFTHAYEDNAGHQTTTDYIYNYGTRRIKYSNQDTARVAVVKMENGRVAATGWICE